jgi:hypothetical protein
MSAPTPMTPNSEKIRHVGNRTDWSFKKEHFTARFAESKPKIIYQCFIFNLDEIYYFFRGVSQRHSQFSRFQNQCSLDSMLNLYKLGRGKRAEEKKDEEKQAGPVRLYSTFSISSVLSFFLLPFPHFSF